MICLLFLLSICPVESDGFAHSILVCFMSIPYSLAHVFALIGGLKGVILLFHTRIPVNKRMQYVLFPFVRDCDIII